MTDQTIPTPSTLGTLVRQARERAGFSLRNLEAITGIARAKLYRLEHDRHIANEPEVLQRLANALELDRDDLFTMAGYQPSEMLPSLTPYLRAKYRLPPAALAEASEALRKILDRYDREHGAK